MSDFEDMASKRCMFSAADEPVLANGDSMRAIELAAMELFMAHPAAAREAAEQWGAVLNDAGLSSTESAQLADIGATAFKTLPTPDLVSIWVEPSKAALVQDFGPRGAAQALTDARRFVELHAGPDLREVPDATGLGNHPTAIRIITAKAWAMRQAGKL